jgi:hypothetical protein
VAQVVLVAEEDTAQEVVAVQSLPQMVERQLLVKDMQEELVESQTIMVAAVVVAVHLLAEMRVHQLAVMEAQAQHQS